MIHLLHPDAPPSSADAQAALQALSFAWTELLRPSVWTAGLTGALATWGLSTLARRWGWVDAARGPDGSRKLQSVPAPLVGGTAVLLGLFAAWCVARVLGESSGWGVSPLLDMPSWSTLGGTIGIDRPATWCALLCAFAVGLVDDLRTGGLSPRAKLVGQTVAGGLLVAPSLWLVAQGSSEFAAWVPLAWVLGAVVVQNAINTFDNADGTATSLASLALLFSAPAAAAALLGFLPFNLLGRVKRRRGPREPRRPVERPYLGDSGSHLLGLLILIHPLAWPVLLLPALDLARVAWVRWRLGFSPFAGDRRHLAHRLAAAGLSSFAVVSVLLMIAAPTLIATLRAASESFARESLWGAPRWIPLGVFASIVLFVVAVYATPDPDQRGVPQR